MIVKMAIMDWMHESVDLNSFNSPKVVLSGFSKAYTDDLRKRVKVPSLELLPAEIDKLHQLTLVHECPVLLTHLTRDSFNLFAKQFEKISLDRPLVAFLIVCDDLCLDQLDFLINKVKVFAILDSSQNISDTVRKAIEDNFERLKYHQTLSQLKEQNVKLESLNENLEQLVHERTKKEYSANRQAEASLKDIQSILSFIKKISRSDSIEDLMGHVRGEFKKIHGLMPPVLILMDPNRGASVFYFQGKQFTEKKNLNQLTQFFYSNEPSQLRAGLSNLFGRPYGAVSVTDLSFTSSELEQMSAKIIFEHSLGESDQKKFAEFSLERSSLFNMALENILLKEGLQSIAKQWSKTFNEMKDPIVILDENLKITLSNSYFHEQILADAQNLHDATENEKLIELIKKTFLDGKSHSEDISIKGKVFRVHCYPIRLIESEVVTHVISQYVDVTQSIDLHSQVVQGEKMAAVGLLAGNIAHELNNPLTGIYSLSQLLLDDFDQHTNTYKDLFEIKEAASRCQRIIKDLLEFSSIGSETKVKKIDLNQLVEKTLPMLKMAMRSLNSNIQLFDEPILIECNPQLLQQVIFNLVNNACQAMEEGGELSVVVETGSHKAYVRVRDNGPGIPADIRQSIFDPFFTTKVEGEGTGLGLSMSKSIVERLGGKLLINENYNDGTEFVVEIPRN